MTTDETTTREFYLPATFQFSHGPGFVERLLLRLTARADELPVRPATEEPAYNFYMPGTTRDGVARPGVRPRPR